MIRRNARLRREYIYRKSVESRKARLEENKQMLKDALKDANDLPTELKADALRLHDRIDWDEAAEDGLLPEDIDDEYRWAGTRDPVVVVTTSRKPSAKIKTFSKELRLLIPNAVKVNRGSYELNQVVDALRAREITDLVVVNGTRSGPSSLVVSHLPHGPTAVFTLHNVVMREELFKDQQTTDRDGGDEAARAPKNHMPQEYPHLSITGFNSTPLARRAAAILKFLFPVPKEEAKRVIALAAGVSGGDSISLRQYSYRWSDKAPSARDFKSRRKEIVLQEHGPRFEMILYKIFRGSIEQHKTADLEFIQRPYMTTAHKRLFIAAPRGSGAKVDEQDDKRPPKKQKTNESGRS